MLMVLMMVGGTAFSTAGGIKVGRFLLIYQRLAKKDTMDIAASVSAPATEKMFRDSIIVIVLYVVIALASGAALGVLEDAAPGDALFEAISALTLTGLSTGIIEIDSDFASKVILMANMVAGRFEVIAILYIFFAWLRR
jgi:trk system potassium uptake protein TrkH